MEEAHWVGLWVLNMVLTRATQNCFVLYTEVAYYILYGEKRKGK